jgi:hypothetical protein
MKMSKPKIDRRPTMAAYHALIRMYCELDAVLIAERADQRNTSLQNYISASAELGERALDTAFDTVDDLIAAIGKLAEAHAAVVAIETTGMRPWGVNSKTKRPKLRSVA